MNTILPIFDDRALKVWPNANELKHSYHEVTRGLRNGTKYILITGKSRNGKSKLLFTITKDIIANYRLIFLRGKDLSFSDNLIISNTHSNINGVQKTCSHDFNLLLECVIGSINVNEKIIIIVDDADKLPINKLAEFLNIHIDNLSNHHSLQFILSGLPKLQKKLQRVINLPRQNFLHSSIDKLTSKSIRPIAPVKVNSDKLHINWHGIEQDANEVNSRYTSKVTHIIDFLLGHQSILNNKYKLFKNTKSIFTKPKSFIQQFILAAFNYNAAVLASIKAAFVKCIDKSHIEFSSIKNTFSLKFNSFLELSQKAAIKSKNKIESVINNRSAATSLPSWVKNTAAMVFVFSLVSIFSYQVRSTEKQLLMNTQPILVNSTATFPGYSDIPNENSNINLDQNTKNPTVKLKSNVENTPIDTSIINEIPAFKIYAPKLSVEVSSANTEQEQDELLDLATQQFEANKLTIPAGDNAYETYQFILFTSPNHAAAREGLKKIHSKYIGWANHYLKNNDLNRAKNFLSKALVIEPNNKLTLSALKDLKIADTQYNNRTKLLLLTESEPSAVRALLYNANEKLLMIERDIVSGVRDYKKFLDAQLDYKKILKLYPNSKSAIAGLVIIKNHYLLWAELESKNKNYHTSTFLHKQAESLHIYNAKIKQQAEKI